MTRLYALFVVGMLMSLVTSLHAVSWVGSTMSVGDGNFVYVTSNIRGAGYVGVGTSTPTSNLVVSGNLRVHGTVTAPLLETAIIGSEILVDWSRGARQLFGIDSVSPIEITLSNPPAGPALLSIMLIYSITTVGGFPGTLTFNPAVYWSMGTVFNPTQLGNRHCLISLFYDGSNYYGIGNAGYDL